MPIDGQSEAIVQGKIRSGAYSDISTMSASIQKTFKSDNQWHSGRLMFQNEKEGPYISTPRFYGNYSIQISINNNLKLLGGAAFGMINPNYNTPSKTVSTSLIDGSLGIIVIYKKSIVGVSSNQIFNNSSELNTSIKLNRYYNFIFETTLPVQENIEFKPYILFRYFSDIPSHINTLFSVIYDKIIETGIGYNYNRGATVYTSVNLESGFKVGALYNSLITSKTPVLGSSFELNLAYQF